MDDPWLMQTLGTKYFAVFNMMISSKNANQNMLKNSFFFEKICKNSLGSGGPPPDPSWLPAAGGSAPRPPPSCDLTRTYFTTTKRSGFVALFNEGFMGKF